MRHCTYKNLHQLTFLPHIFPVNAYIFEELNNLTVIDAGVKNFVKPIQKMSRKLKKPVTKILLTHPHVDHLGGLDALKKAFPKAQVGLSARDTALLEGNFSLQNGEPDEKIKGGFKKVATKIDWLLTDGKSIESLAVIATPGHTPRLTELLRS